MSTAGCRICNFNPRSRKGSDKRQADIAERIDQFQSTLPQGERLQRFGSKHIILSDFNPRSRKGSDSEALKIQQFWDDISIHAPARGATLQNLAMRLTRCISIHAPARGATELQSKYSVSRSISIHAPARGATKPGRLSWSWMKNFNPRSRKGSDTNFRNLTFS